MYLGRFGLLLIEMLFGLPGIETGLAGRLRLGSWRLPNEGREQHGGSNCTLANAPSDGQ